MKVLIIFLLANGTTAEVPTTLKPYEFCSDKTQEYVRYVDNPNYKSGNGEIWVHTMYKDQQVLFSRCETLDRKYYVSYYNPEWEKNKSFDILD